MGAVGMALVAQNEYKRTNYKTKFRGYDVSKINYSLKEFTCKSCSNQCDIQEFSVENNKTYWGDKCSEKFRKAAKTNLKPVTKDVFKEREELLYAAFNKYHNSEDINNANKKTVGFPRAMYFYDRLPFWAVFFGELGFKMILSDPTNKQISKKGVETAVAEPCYPIKVAHGHVSNLIDKKPDYIFIPAMITAECDTCEEDKAKVSGRKQVYFCPWGQTLHDVIRGNMKFSEYKNKLITPKMELREGDDFVIEDLTASMKEHFSWIHKRDVAKAYHLALHELANFRSSLVSLYEEAVKAINESDREAIVIIGRPYNVNDSGINLNITTKLRDFYGVNVLPIDTIPIADIDIDDVNNNMFWGYGRRILATLKKLRTRQKMHVIYITNFQCGPDSYIKHFAPEALGKSFLTLQFDGHGNDAGMITRCEAYLDSKGVFQQ
jgi:predicted nucleotide-binding protein (sugar kinase/HSP70/actin superfamily)